MAKKQKLSNAVGRSEQTLGKHVIVTKPEFQLNSKATFLKITDALKLNVSLRITTQSKINCMKKLYSETNLCSSRTFRPDNLLIH